MSSVLYSLNVNKVSRIFRDSENSTFTNNKSEFFFQVLLISSSRHSDRWVIPGGKMETDEAPEYCAMREALEESGAEGDIGRCLGIFDNTDRGHRTRVYVLYVNRLTDEYQEKDVRKRKWVGLDEAQKLLGSNKPLQAKYILAMKQSKTSTTNPDAGSGSSAWSLLFLCNFYFILIELTFPSMIYEEDVEKKTKTICYSILFYFTHSFWLKRKKNILN